MTKVLVQFNEPTWVELSPGRKFLVKPGKPQFLRPNQFRNLDPQAYREYDDSGNPGDRLHDLLEEAGITPSKNCRCEQFRQLMNLYGDEWVLDNVTLVASWVRQASAAPMALLKELVLMALEREAEDQEISDAE